MPPRHAHLARLAADVSVHRWQGRTGGRQHAAALKGAGVVISLQVGEGAGAPRYTWPGNSRGLKDDRADTIVSLAAVIFVPEGCLCFVLNVHFKFFFSDNLLSYYEYWCYKHIQRN